MTLCWWPYEYSWIFWRQSFFGFWKTFDPWFRSNLSTFLCSAILCLEFELWPFLVHPHFIEHLGIRKKKVFFYLFFWVDGYFFAFFGLHNSVHQQFGRELMAVFSSSTFWSNIYKRYLSSFFWVKGYLFAIFGLHNSVHRQFGRELVAMTQFTNAAAHTASVPHLHLLGSAARR